MPIRLSLKLWTRFYCSLISFRLVRLTNFLSLRKSDQTLGTECIWRFQARRARFLWDLSIYKKVGLESYRLSTSFLALLLLPECWMLLKKCHRFILISNSPCEMRRCAERSKPNQPPEPESTKGDPKLRKMQSSSSLINILAGVSLCKRWHSSRLLELAISCLQQKC